MYYRIKEDIYSEFGTVTDPAIPLGVSFFTGHVIAESFDLPMRFLVDNPPQDPPGGLEGITIPAFSAGLVNIFKNCGVDNLQLFDAVLINDATNQMWDNYFAVNIIGLISCADTQASTATLIGKRPNDSIALHKFHNLVIDPRKAYHQLIFRLAEQPSTIVVHEKLLEALDKHPNPNGEKWKISCFPIEET